MQLQKIFKLALGVFLACPAFAEPARPLAEILPAFETIARQLFEETGVPGMSVAVVYKDEVVYLKGFGVRTARNPTPVDPDTVFQVASCSKPITSTALAALTGAGVFQWDDPVQKYLPEFQLSDPWVSRHLTFRDLLSHHSGLPQAAGDVLENLGLDRAAVLKQLRHFAPAYDFRVGYGYSNYGFTAGAEAASRAAGSPYEQMMETRLFGPLGMTSSSARYEDFLKNPNRASSHVLGADKQAAPTVRMPQAQAPAGGVSSSARDMASWMRLHLNEGKWQGKQFIPAAELAQTYRVHSLASNNPATFSASGFYGLGWGLAYDHQGRLRLSHSGAFALGVRSAVTMVPQEKVGIVVLSNAYPSALPEALSVIFLRMYDGESADLALARTIHSQVSAGLQSMLAADYKVQWPEKPEPALPLDRYAGTYDSEFFGKAVVSRTGDGLRLRLGTQNFVLKHLTRDAFVFAGDKNRFEDIEAFELQFVLDGQGRVSGFRQQGLAQEFPWFARK